MNDGVSSVWSQSKDGCLSDDDGDQGSWGLSGCGWRNGEAGWKEVSGEMSGVISAPSSCGIGRVTRHWRVWSFA